MRLGSKSPALLKALWTLWFELRLRKRLWKDRKIREHVRYTRLENCDGHKFEWLWFFSKLDNLYGFRSFGDKKFGMKIRTESLWSLAARCEKIYAKGIFIERRKDFNIIYNQSWKWSYTCINILKFKIFASMKIRVYIEYNGYVTCSNFFGSVKSKIKFLSSLTNLLNGFKVSRYFWSASINFPTIFNKTDTIQRFHFFHQNPKINLSWKKYQFLELRITFIRNNIVHQVGLMIVFIRRNRDETHGCRPRSRQGNLDRDKKRKRKILQHVSSLSGASSIARKAASFTWI